MHGEFDVMDFRNMCDIRCVLLLAALLLRCNGLSHRQTRGAGAAGASDELKQFRGGECGRPDENKSSMSKPKVTVCINPCGAKHIDFIGDYSVEGKTKKIRLNISIEQPEKYFSVNLVFTRTGNYVLLNLTSRVFNKSRNKPETSPKEQFDSWSVKHGKKNLPFYTISAEDQCDFHATTHHTTLSPEGTTLSMASTDGTESTEDEQSALKAFLAENMIAFITGGLAGLGIFIIIIIILAVRRTRRKRSILKPDVQNAKAESGGDEEAGGVLRRCSVNSTYESTPCPKPLERHESINSLYGKHDDFTTEQDSAAKLNQLLKPSRPGNDSSNIYEPV